MIRKQAKLNNGKSFSFSYQMGHFDTFIT